MMLTINENEMGGGRQPKIDLKVLWIHNKQCFRPRYTNLFRMTEDLITKVLYCRCETTVFLFIRHIHTGACKTVVSRVE